MACLFTASHPKRTSSLVLWGTYPRAIRDEDFPEGLLPASQVEADIAETERIWIKADFTPSRMTEGVSAVEEERATRWYERLCRMAVSPGAAVTYARMAFDFDIRALLPSIRVPTLCLVRTSEENAPPPGTWPSTYPERDSSSCPERFTTLHSVTRTLPFKRSRSSSPALGHLWSQDESSSRSSSRTLLDRRS